MISQFARRVDQLDAVSFDSELFSLLSTQYRKAFSYFPSSVIVNYGPELDALFRFMFQYLPLECLDSTFGQSVFQLKYYDNKTLSPASKNKLRILAAITVGLPWFWSRIVQKIIIGNYCRNDRSLRIFEASYSIERKFIFLWKMLSLLNFCVFLQRAKFSSVTERILQIRPVYTTPQDIRVLQYGGTTRELLWHGLHEFLGFTLPMINVHRIKNSFRRFWLSWCCRDQLRKYRSKDENCPVCGSIPNFPHTIGCDHVFCYYCIASMVLADPTFICIDCNFAASGLDNIIPVPINKPTLSA